jgi:hypothetical protein
LRTAIIDYVQFTRMTKMPSFHVRLRSNQRVEPRSKVTGACVWRT